MGVQEFFSRREQPYPFQVADKATQMNVHTTLYSFYLIDLCWMNLNSQAFVKMFSALPLSEMLFIFKTA